MPHRIHWNVFTYMSAWCFLVFIKLDLPKYPMDFDGMIPQPRSFSGFHGVCLTPFLRQRKAYDAAARGDFSVTHSLYQLFLRRLDWKLEQSWSCRTVHLEIFKQIREVYMYVYIYISLRETMKPFSGDWMPRVYIYTYTIKNRYYYEFTCDYFFSEEVSNFWEVYGT